MNSICIIFTDYQSVRLRKESLIMTFQQKNIGGGGGQKSLSETIK